MDTGYDPVATPRRVGRLYRRGAAPPGGGARRVLRDYEPGPNLCTNLRLHRSRIRNVSLFGPCRVARQHRRPTILDLVVENPPGGTSATLACRHHDEHPARRGNEAGAGSAQQAHALTSPCSAAPVVLSVCS